MKIAVTVTLVALGLVSLAAQDRLRTMPGYDQFQKMQSQIPGSWVSGAVSVTWEPGGRGFTYVSGGKNYRFDVATMKATEVAAAATAPIADAAGRGARAAGAGRGQGAPPA